MTEFTIFVVNPVIFGGDKRDRTADLLNAIQALSQLSYTPILCCHSPVLFPSDLFSIPCVPPNVNPKFYFFPSFCKASPCALSHTRFFIRMLSALQDAARLAI